MYNHDVSNHYDLRFKPIKTSWDSIYKIKDWWEIHPYNSHEDSYVTLSDTTKWYYIPNFPNITIKD